MHARINSNNFATGDNIQNPEILISQLPHHSWPIIRKDISQRSQHVIETIRKVKTNQVKLSKLKIIIKITLAKIKLNQISANYKHAQERHEGSYFYSQNGRKKN